MQAVILAGGRGSRLRPFTDHCTKAMAPILGKPIAFRVMEQMMACGLRDFILVTNPNDLTIEPYFKNIAEEFTIHIRFVPQPKQLGMGHALLTAAPFIEDDFILSACDNLVKDNVMPEMLRCFQEEGTNAVLLLKTVLPEGVSATAIVEFDEQGKEIINILEKPAIEEAPTDIASLPLYVFKQVYLDYLPEVKASIRGEIEMQDAMRVMMNDLGGYFGVHTDWRLTLTTPQDLFEINQYFLKKQQPATIASSAVIAPSAQLIAPYVISEGVEISANTVVGPNVYIDTNCKIEENAHIHNSLLMLGNTLAKSEVLESEIRYG